MAKLPIIFLLFISILQQGKAEDGTVKKKFIPATIYTTKNGLLSNNIQDIAQDDEGFLWIATTRGLNRFDSISFKGFINDKSDSLSIPDNFIEDLVIMPDGKLWLSINEQGISIFDISSYKTSHFKNSSSKLFKLPNSNLYGIDKDKSGNAWLSLFGEGIYHWDTTLEIFSKHVQSDKNAWLTSKETFEVLVDTQNRLWVCTIDSKVYRYDIDTGKSKAFDFTIDGGKSSPIYGFTESPAGEIYAGGFSGVYKYDEGSKSFEQILSKEKIASYYDERRTSARRLLVDSKDNLWIGTTESLLQYSNNKLFKVQIYENGEVLETSGWKVHSLLESRDGNIWIGTEGIGLLKLAPDWARYNIYYSEEKEPIDLRRALMFENNIWLVHPSSRIDLLEYNNEKLTFKRTIRPDLGSDQIRINTIYQDHEDFLWVSSISGIHKINTKTGQASMVLEVEGKRIDNVQQFIRASNNRFYFYRFSETLGYFDEDDMLAHFIENTPGNHLQGNIVNQLEEGLDGKIWIATNHGIETLDTQNNQFEEVYTASVGQTINSFYFESETQNVWTIINGGLFKMVWDGEKLTIEDDRYKDLLPKVQFSTIEKYTDGVLMVTTLQSGLVEIDVNSLAHRLYTKENGLPSNNIEEILFKNEMPILVTQSGVAIKNKHYFEGTPVKPRLVIDKIALGEKIISINDETGLLLDNNFGSLNFDVVLLSYTNVSSTEYQYKISQKQTDWISSGNDNKFSFMKLAAGDYNFQIRGRSNYGPWSEIKEFPFSVKSPPWKTNWAYFLYFLAGIFLMAWLFYLYKRKLLYEHEIIKEQAQKKMANAASKAKSDFLARVSHEVRTPLNGVLGMGELMLDTDMDEEQQIYADSIIASGKHLLDIINDILDLSKIEAGKMELESEPFNLLYLVDEIVGTFTSQAKEKELLFTCYFDAKLEIHRLGDAIRIKQILFNLLSNAFKFTKQGQIKLHLSSDVNGGNSVAFRIEDTGIGIDEKTIEDLFKPFVQADSAITRKFGGTGLGLAIVKQLAEKMDGQIKVKGIVGQGSIFTVNLVLNTNTAAQATPQIIPEPKQFCLLVQQKDLRMSLHQSFERLNVEFTSQINDFTQCLFVDVLFSLEDKQVEAINQAIKNNIELVLIGFDLKRVNNIVSIKNTPIKLLSPPVTYKKLKQICVIDPEINFWEIDVLPETVIQKALNLLVVEDNAINQQVSIEMLEKMGHCVDIIDSAEEALIMLGRSKYDLLLVDYHLPGMDGLSMLKTWDNKTHVPVIVVTADLTDELYRRCNKMGITNIVAKPFTRQVLSEAIAKAIENS